MLGVVSVTTTVVVVLSEVGLKRTVGSMLGVVSVTTTVVVVLSEVGLKRVVSELGLKIIVGAIVGEYVVIVVAAIVGTNVGGDVTTATVGVAVGEYVVAVVVVVVVVVVSSTYSEVVVGDSLTGLRVCHGPLECVGFSVGAEIVTLPVDKIKSMPLLLLLDDNVGCRVLYVISVGSNV
jgi:hypothetical protein